MEKNIHKEKEILKCNSEMISVPHIVKCNRYVITKREFFFVKINPITELY